MNQDLFRKNADLIISLILRWGSKDRTASVHLIPSTTPTVRLFYDERWWCSKGVLGSLVRAPARLRLSSEQCCSRPDPIISSPLLSSLSQVATKRWVHSSLSLSPVSCQHSTPQMPFLFGLVQIYHKFYSNLYSFWI